MHTFSTLPAAEGFRMPAEYEPHRGCVMIWPVRPGSWLYGGRDAQPAFAQAARAIAESETVWMLAGPADAGAVQAEFAGDENIHVLTGRGLAVQRMGRHGGRPLRPLGKGQRSRPRHLRSTGHGLL